MSGHKTRSLVNLTYSEVSKKKNKKNRKNARRKTNNRLNTSKREIQNAISEMFLPSLSSTKNDMASFQYQINMFRYTHEVAVWKSKALALEAENRILHDTIRAMQSNGYNSRESATKESYNRSFGGLLNSRPQSISESESESEAESEAESEPESDNSELEFEVNDQYLEFMEKSARFKIERDEARNINPLEVEKKRLNAPPDESINLVRLGELKLLYGDDYKDILNIETEMELNFDCFVDKNKPMYWEDLNIY